VGAAEVTGAAVELRGVTVRYGDVEANREVSLTVAEGEVHAIVGENGAGKSTLMRALYGLAPLAAGEVRVRGETVARPSPAESIRRGVGMVHQHFMLVPPLSVAENVVLGDEPRARTFLGKLRFERRRAEAEVRAVAEKHRLEVARGADWPRRRVADLSVGEQQRVEILKALWRGARILILDEPTAVLSPPEVAELFAVLRALAAAGGTVLLVTHKLDEVTAIADRVTVLRRGEVTARFQRGAMTPTEIARAMVGRDVEAVPHARVAPGPVRLEARALSVAGRAGGLALDGVSFALRGGEILGVAGVEGNGQAELVEVLVGLARARRGEVLLDGAPVTDLPVRERRRRGLGYVPEDRHARGLLLDSSVADNLLLGRDQRYARFGVIDRARLISETRELIDRFDVRPASPASPARALSGGNQQKVVIARELSRRPGVLVAAQPTRGVDVGAIEHIHRELDGVREGGGAVLLLSAELDELLALADRIAVLFRGRLVATLPRAEASPATLGPLMTGASS
jgi:simple sugar transport system ATP-binding protein